MSALKRGIQDINTKNSIKSKNYWKSETLRKLEKLQTLIDWYVAIKLSVQWAEEHVRKDVCRLNSKLTSTTDTQYTAIWRRRGNKHSDRTTVTGRVCVHISDYRVQKFNAIKDSI